MNPPLLKPKLNTSKINEKNIAINPVINEMIAKL
jgi:hypothetical protein